MKESVVECLKNAKTVLDAVGPLVLEHDKTCILTQGVASARNWCESILKEKYPGWHLVSEDGFPTHDKAVAIFPPFLSNEFACWNKECDCWYAEHKKDAEFMERKRAYNRMYRAMRRANKKMPSAVTIALQDIGLMTVHLVRSAAA